MKITERIKSAWNAFKNDSEIEVNKYEKFFGPSYSYRPDRIRLNTTNERSIINSLYNRIALDVAQTQIKHVQCDFGGRFLYELDTKLNRCLSFSSNIDQTARSFFQDVVLTLCDEGTAAIVPVDCTDNPDKTQAYDIESLRVGTIKQWYPNSVKMEVYNETDGKKETITMSKNNVAIVQNPLYLVMNEPNSTLKRLIRKLNILDAIDEQSGSGKLDIIIQLPYVIKTEARRQQAEQRRKDVEEQLAGSKYGIAYTDGTEKITQLNRPAENNLQTQIEYLTGMLYSQLGLTDAIFNGTASEQELENYYNRTIEPILSAIVDEMNRKFISQTALTQNKKIKFFRDPFKILPTSAIAGLADSLTRNEILSSNEIRAILGYAPSEDPKADELVNSNLNQPSEDRDSISNENELEKMNSTNDSDFQEGYNQGYDDGFDDAQEDIGGA